MHLSAQQIQELIKIIDKNQLVIVGSELGSDYLTEYDKTILRSYGINPDGLYQPYQSSIDTSFHFGMLADALGAMEASKVTYTDIKEYVKGGKYIPLSYQQEAMLNSIKAQTFSSLKKLNGNIFADVNNIIANNTAQAQREFLAQELKTGIEQKKSVRQIANAIAEKTGDWGRDFDRIIETASQTAYLEGKAADIERKNPGKDPLVYKQPQETACKHCIRLYLEGGYGSKPKIFKLSELRANGTNIGRKVADWKPIVGATHPFCKCPLFELNEGYLWNPEKQSFSTPDSEYKIQTAAKRPLVKVTIRDEIKYL